MILLSRSIKILYDWNRAFCKKIRRIVLQRKVSVANRTIFVGENPLFPLESECVISYNYRENQRKERCYEPDSVSDNRQ